MDLPVRWGPVENTAAWDAAVTVTTTDRTGVARTAWILIPRMVAMNETMQIAERQMPDGDPSVQHSAKVLAEAAPLVLRLLRELASINRRRHRARLGQQLSRANSFDRGSWFESGRRVWSIIGAPTRGAGALHSLMYLPVGANHTRLW